MATESSFDIVSEVDLQIIDDCVNVSTKEIANRFDLKGKNCTIEFNRTDKTLVFHAPSEFEAKQVLDIFNQKLAKRSVNPKAVQHKKSEKASGGSVREHYAIIIGIETDLAKQMVKDIKATGIKVQASIMEGKIRVSGKDKDDLQAVIKAVRDKEYPVALQFTNYR